ncbi:MAG: M67 family metallopeptidase [Deltaproteobacteria bacterium]|nr:M67 family metallopeptidase [Deltaproteobacteria bacterium]
MKTQKLKIPSFVYLQIIAHAQEEWPNEACGILAGTDDEIKRAYPLENQERSPERFSISAEDQLRILEDIEKNDLKMVGVYHSHPHTDPYPSETDIKYSIYPDVFTVIISLKRREKPRVCIFSLENSYVSEVEYTII